MSNIELAITNIQMQHKQIGIDYTESKDMTAVCLVGEQAEATILALQKQIPQKPIESEYEGFICPACNGGFIFSPHVAESPHQHFNYCNECGQKLDWD